jgi:trigger factor
MENQESNEMKLSVEEPSQTKRILKIEVPPTEIADEFKKTYQSFQKKVKWPGFRAGKVPLQMIRNRMGREVEEDLLQRMIPRYYATALDKTELQPVDMPIIQNVQLKEGEPFRFDATVYLKPEFEVKEYKGIPRDSMDVEVSDEMVENVLQDLRERFAALSSYEDEAHAVAMKDIAEIDFEGFIEEQLIEGGKGENHLVEVGTGRMLTDLEDGLIGMKRDEKKEIEAHFPEDYHKPDLAGQKALFKVHLKDVKEKKLPELDDEFAKDVGETFATLEELQAEIRKNIQSREEERIREELHLEMMDEVLRRNPIEELPEVMVQRQKANLKENMEAQFSQSGMDMESPEMEKMLADDKLEEKAKRDVAWSLILEQIAKKEEIAVTSEEVETELEKRAWKSSMTKEVMRDLYMQQMGSLEPFRLNLLNEKILDFLLENAKVKEKGQTGGEGASEA